MKKLPTSSTRIASRRLLLKSAVVGGLAAIPLIAVRESIAAAKAPKAAMQYQDTPHGKDECDDCLQFIPGSAASAPGTCKVVDGAINPHGWCIAFVRKPA